MSGEKQIDEMAKLICTYPQCIHHNIIGECANAECQTVDIAENLYKQGYRKQSEGEWVRDSFKAKTGEILYHTPACSVCGMANSFMTNYCPNCGAKMKGGTE